MNSDALASPFLFFGRREGEDGDFVGDLGLEADSHRHSQVSGGRQEYCCFALGATDQTSELIATSSISTGVADFPFGTGNSNVAVVGDLSKSVWKGKSKGVTHRVDRESSI